MTNTQPAVGIHVSKLKLDVALLARGEIQNKVVENDLAGFRWLRDWLTRHEVSVAGLPVCMEATGPYSEAAALALTAMGMVVSDVDPERVQAFASSAPAPARQSGIDAVLLARFCAETRPAPWVPPPVAFRALRAWLAQLHALRTIRLGESRRRQNYQLAGQEALAEHVRAAIACLDGQVRQLERDIDAHLHRHPALARNVELVKRAPAPAGNACLPH
ncbi:transposase [Janthinobacterium sp. CG_23.3]|uniref:transposase n=1 Tax=unclassified Janthinobacterium TaxID=2610881 RepID=UPI00034C2798|nr:MULTISPECIES: transposase [unclassified Janthinobacterium]MEC5159748.1 transposase [Janthinobacterium sp. CG_S6]